MPCKDRLHELRQRADASGRRLSDGERTAVALQDDGDVADVLREVEALHGWLRDLAADTLLMRRLHSDPTFHTSAQLQEQLDAAATRCTGTGLKLAGALRQLEGRATAGREEGGGGSTALGRRVARLQVAAARRRFGDALRDHHALLQALRDDRTRLLRDQIRLTNFALAEDEVRALLDADDAALFVDNIRAETAEARRELRDVEARHAELARVEGSLREVRDLFAQLAHLVAVQQEQIDSVEYYALQATERVESGGRHLLKGTVSRARARKKKVGLIICLVTGFLIVLLVLVYT